MNIDLDKLEMITREAFKARQISTVMVKLAEIRDWISEARCSGASQISKDAGGELYLSGAASIDTPEFRVMMNVYRTGSGLKADERFYNIVAHIDAQLARQRQAAPHAPDNGQWLPCTPALLNAGVSCVNTPRRPGDGTYSHDHFIAHGPASAPAVPHAQAEPVAEVIETNVTGTGLMARDVKFIGTAARPGDKLYLAAPVPQEAEQAATAAVTDETVRDRVRDAVADAMTGLYHCGRVWSAWGYGTMHESDFSLAAEDDDIVENIVSAAINAIGAQPAAPAVTDAARDVLADAKDGARYRWLRENCYDTDPAGEGDAFDHPALHFESAELGAYDSSSLDAAIDAEIESRTQSKE